MTTRILLVRHGQSEWNALGRWQGQENPSLTDLGREQARRAARAVGAVEGVYASPLVRATETATIMSEELGVGPVVIDERLMERHAGEWQGLTRSEIDDRYPGYLDEGRRPTGWEDDDHVRDRALAALDRVAADHPHGEVLVVTHAGLIFQVEHALGGDWERLANLAGRFIDHTPQGWHLGERLHLLIEETYPGQI